MPYMHMYAIFYWYWTSSSNFLSKQMGSYVGLLWKIGLLIVVDHSCLVTTSFTHISFQSLNKQNVLSILNWG